MSQVFRSPFTAAFCLLVVVAFLSKPTFSQEDKIGKVLVTADTSLVDSTYDTDLLPITFHAERRQLLRGLMPHNSVAVFFSNPIRNRSNDVDFEYHQDPNFYYLTGLKEPNSMLIVFKETQVVGVDSTVELLFVQGRSKDKEIWDGKRYGVHGAKKELGFDQVFLNTEFADFNLDFSDFEKVLYATLPEDVRDDKKNKGDLFSLVRHLKRKTDTISDKSVKDNKKLDTYMATLRQVKTKEELVLMRKAIKITCEAQEELMKALTPGMKEYQSEAIVEYIFKMNGAEYTGFPSILGGAENSCILHYTTNRKRLDSTHLLVSDIGAEYHGYTADVTRTMPVDGSFSEEERAIYEIVLKAQKAGIAACKKGNKFWDPHDAASREIQKGLMALGITKKWYHSRQYFMHGTSHYLGLDVHDVGLYSSLQPGHVITVEPGIYIPKGSPCDPKWWNIGVRIEDDILITNETPEVLSDWVPREIEEIELLMKEKSILNNLK